MKPFSSSTTEMRSLIGSVCGSFRQNALCQRIAILNKGQIVAQGTPDELKGLVSDLSVVELEVIGAEEEHLDRLRALEFVDSVAIESQELRQVLRVQTKLGERAVPGLLASLNNLDVGRVSVREATLEDAYVHLVGHAE